MEYNEQSYSVYIYSLIGPPFGPEIFGPIQRLVQLGR